MVVGDTQRLPQDYPSMMNINGSDNSLAETSHTHPSVRWRSKGQLIHCPGRAQTIPTNSAGVYSEVEDKKGWEGASQTLHAGDHAQGSEVNFGDRRALLSDLDILACSGQGLGYIVFTIDLLYKQSTEALQRQWDVWLPLR